MLEHYFQRQQDLQRRLRSLSPARPARPARHDPGWRPRITAFFCNSQATSAEGSPLLSYPGLEIVHMRCAGRMDPQDLLQALHDGSDGILMAACGPQRCQRASDGARSVFMQSLTRRLLTALDIRPERVRLVWLDPQDPDAALAAVEDLADTVRALGPLDLPGREALLAEEVEEGLEAEVDAYVR